MDTYLYNCQYCGKEYKPNRRHKQKFCSNSCRANFFTKKKKNELALNPNKEIETQKPLQIERMSWAGVGNAVAGTLAVNAITSVFKKDDDQHATKGDIKKILTTLKQRYQPVKNLGIRPDGAKPFYDINTNEIVYLKPNTYDRTFR